MVGQKLSWVGLSVGDYVVKELLGEGSFSWVFKAVHADGVTARAIKVAKPPEAVAEGGPTSCVPTSAHWQTLGAIVPLSPETEQLLCLQAKRLQTVSDPGLISIEEVSARPGSCYYRMPLLTGTNLRRYMSAGPVPVDILLDIALCVDRLWNTDNFRYHGDLKPENIMITPAGVVLVDPGYFGTIDVYKGGAPKQLLSNVAITSTLYYPFLVADDLFALGLMTWEIACRVHPLAEKATASQFDRTKLGNDLMEVVQREENDGRFFFSSILGLRKPSEMRPGIPPEVEEFLLKCLRVKFDAEGKLRLSSGFNTISDYAAALALLARKSIRYI